MTGTAGTALTMRAKMIGIAMTHNLRKATIWESGDSYAVDNRDAFENLGDGGGLFNLFF